MRNEQTIQKALMGFAENFKMASCDEERISTDTEATRFVYNTIKDPENRITYRIIYEELKR